MSTIRRYPRLFHPLLGAFPKAESGRGFEGKVPYTSPLRRNGGALTWPSCSPRPRLVLGGPGRRRGWRGDVGGGGGRRQVRSGAVGLGAETVWYRCGEEDKFDLRVFDDAPTGENRSFYTDPVYRLV